MNLHNRLHTIMYTAYVAITNKYIMNIGSEQK